LVYDTTWVKRVKVYGGLKLKFLVAGGAGFIGSNYVQMLLQDSSLNVSEVRVLDKLTYAGNLKNLESVRLDSRFSFSVGDICSQSDVESAIAGMDYVINFAAETHVDRSINGPEVFITTNVLGTQNLLEISLRLNVKRYLQVSTDEVYGSILQGSSRESDLLMPNSPYSASKASGDLLVRAYNKTYGLDTIITRCSNNYGPQQYPEKLIPFFISKIINNEKVPIYGSGKNIRDWLHVSDHCRGIHLALMNGQPGEIYNIGGGRELTNLEITQKLFELLDVDGNQIEYVDDRLGHDFRYSVDYSKIRTEAGYEPRIEFEQGLSQTVEWYVNNLERSKSSLA
jgi:dTDP-glucose 4,6-dehydratase